MDRAESFRRTARRLPDVDVISYDRRGYAGSLDLPAAQDLTRHVADALAVAGERRCVMVGHSFGGLVALGAAHQAPHLVEAVALYETPMPWLAGVVAPPPVITDLSTPAEVAESFFIKTVGERAWARLGPETKAERRAEGPALIADLAMADAGPTFDPADILQPVAVAHGADPSNRYRPAARALVAAVHGASLDVFDGAGHGAHLSHPDSFAAWIAGVAVTETHH